jgi:hypothetical protein
MCQATSGFLCLVWLLVPRVLCQLSPHFLQGDAEQAVDLLKFSTILLASNVTPQIFKRLRDMPHDGPLSRRNWRHRPWFRARYTC